MQNSGNLYRTKDLIFFFFKDFSHLFENKHKGRVRGRMRLPTEQIICMSGRIRFPTEQSLTWGLIQVP